MEPVTRQLRGGIGCCGVAPCGRRTGAALIALPACAHDGLLCRLQPGWIGDVGCILMHGARVPGSNQERALPIATVRPHSGQTPLTLPVRS